MLIPESDRGPLTDLVRALNADAWDGALTDARLKYGDVLRGIDKYWTKNPWLTVLPHEGSPPISILIDNQGVINDGSMWDKDPTDDPLLAAAWDNAIRTWDIDFLRDNPLAVLFTKVESAASNIVDTAGDVADGAQPGGEEPRQDPRVGPLRRRGHRHAGPRNPRPHRRVQGRPGPRPTPAPAGA
jgi:hypothetical protein